jgi:hypothetical protein
MKQNKSKFRSGITDMHLHVMMWIGISEMELNVLILFRSKGRPKFHINKVRLGYFCCNVQFCVSYVRDVWMLQPL